MSIAIKLEAFEGPMHLLLHLIDKNKIDIYDIPIVQITEQYLEYIKDIQSNDLDIMSEFLVMAAYLLKIKSKMLLPIDESEEECEDPRQELVDRLLEYVMFKHISNELKDELADASRVLYKQPSIPDEINEMGNIEVDISEILKDLSLYNLHKVYESIIKKQKDKIDPVRSKFGEIEQEDINLTDKLLKIQNYGIKHKEFMFSELFDIMPSKMEVIVTFLGVLELMKVGIVEVSQNELFDDILIVYLADEIVQIGEVDF
ncbi:MAG TPA: segregation/condensation protein A [Clostridiales bacterium]|nr:segregation/condensation protein A [Clostridiales bacterium]